MTVDIDLNEAKVKIQALNLQGVRNDLINVNEFSEERADRALAWYRMFLEFVAENPGVHLAPPRAADQAWHNHILDTRRYMDDCLDIFGGYLHHDPEAFGTTLFDEGWGFTRELYETRYGVALPVDPLPSEDEAVQNGDMAATDAHATTCYLAGIERIGRDGAATADDTHATTCYVAGVEKIGRDGTAAADDTHATTCYVAGVEKIGRDGTAAADDTHATTCYVAGVEKIGRDGTAAADDTHATTCYVAGVEKIGRDGAAAADDTHATTCYVAGVEKIDRPG